MAEELTRTSGVVRGRGTAENPKNRFEEIKCEVDDYCEPGEAARPKTIFLKDSSRTIVTKNNSPDVGFEVSINPYRGCEHGCVYCYARPTHEYLGFSAGLDFETKIIVKENAPELLREKLASVSWKPQVIAISGVTDAYQPIERKLQITRQCLEVLVEFRNPIVIITKNHLVVRDIDILKEFAKFDAVQVYLSVTTLDPDLCAIMEPRTARPALRLETIRSLSQAGIPVGVNVAPIIPGLTDHEIPSILAAAHEAGATSAGYTIVRLPYAVKDLFEKWLERHRPNQKDKVLNRIRQMREGKLNESTFSARMHGHGVFAKQIKSLFSVTRKKIGFEEKNFSLSTAHFRRPTQPGEQLDFFSSLSNQLSD